MRQLFEELRSADFGGSVLAVPNDALNEVLSTEEKQALIEDTDDLRAFLKRHILTGHPLPLSRPFPPQPYSFVEAVCCHALGRASLFRPRLLKTLAKGVRLGSSGGREPAIGGVPVADCDVPATNGLLHILAGPIPAPRRASRFSLFGRPAFELGPWDCWDGFTSADGDEFNTFDWPF